MDGWIDTQTNDREMYKQIPAGPVSIFYGFFMIPSSSLALLPDFHHIVQCYWYLQIHPDATIIVAKQVVTADFCRTLNGLGISPPGDLVELPSD